MAERQISDSIQFYPILDLDTVQVRKRYSQVYMPRPFFTFGSAGPYRLFADESYQLVFAGDSYRILGREREREIPADSSGR